MSSIVFDIETVAFDFDLFDEEQKKYLLKFADTEEKIIEEKNKLALYPFTARIISIGMINPSTMNGEVFYISDEKNYVEKNGIKYFSFQNEKDILKNFWEIISKFDQIVTFNGRSFDCPFITIRSAILGVIPTRNLNSYRYDTKMHFDIFDQLSFYGAVSRKFNLDFICKSFGIESPKSKGITGLNLSQFFGEKKFFEIAEYCIGDVIATAKLFEILKVIFDDKK